MIVVVLAVVRAPEREVSLIHVTIAVAIGAGEIRDIRSGLTSPDQEVGCINEAIAVEIARQIRWPFAEIRSQEALAWQQRDGGWYLGSRPIRLLDSGQVIRVRRQIGERIMSLGVGYRREFISLDRKRPAVERAVISVSTVFDFQSPMPDGILAVENAQRIGWPEDVGKRRHRRWVCDGLQRVVVERCAGAVGDTE